MTDGFNRKTAVRQQFESASHAQFVFVINRGDMKLVTEQMKKVRGAEEAGASQLINAEAF